MDLSTPACAGIPEMNLANDQELPRNNTNYKQPRCYVCPFVGVGGTTPEDGTSVNSR